jgi:serine/threonine protein phosphatase PrpC
MAEEIKPQTEEEKVTVKSAATEEVKEKLEDAAESIIQKAQNSSNPWYTKMALYIAAVVVGGLAFLMANFGDTIMLIIEKWLNGLAQ